MKFIVYIVVFCLLFYMLLLSFDDRNRQFADDELNDVGATFVGAGEETGMATAYQMQQDENIYEAQEYHDTVLDVAIEAAKEELRQLDLSTQRLFKDVWSKTKSSAFKMAEDVAYLIYPPRAIKNPRRGFTAIHLQNERLLSDQSYSCKECFFVFPVKTEQTNRNLHKTPFKKDIK